ncbi:MAG: hypothetical protein JF589_08905 [Gemmatimonadetes bacterium]|nr:hypothetical protein [Gemmatimonadota bacterium]
MRIPLNRMAGFAVAALFLASAPPAQAQGKGHGKGHDKHEQAQVRRDDHDRDHERDPRYENRSGHDYRYDQGRQSIPPGLAKKPGGMPPGQYRKLYDTGQGAYVLSDVLGRHGYHVLRTADAGDSRYVYYRDRSGNLHRAIVSPGADRLRFSSVPNSLLNEVIARLY